MSGSSYLDGAVMVLMLWWWIAVRIEVWFAYFRRHKSARRGRRVADVVFCRAQSKPAWVTREIIRLKALMPDAGCRTVANVFNRRYAASRKMTVGKSFVANTIRRYRYEIEVIRRKIKHRVPSALPRNLVWAMDLTGKRDVAGDTHMILGLVDHGTRALLALSAIPDKCSWTLLGHLFLSIGKYGKPRAVRTDNEACFTSRVFRTILLLSGIRHQRSELHCPWQNGRIERLFGTLKQKLDQWQVASFEALNISLTEFRFFYNVVRPHQHLGGCTPHETWCEVNPFVRRAKLRRWFLAWDGLLQGEYLLL
jgi:transposase InsO family protein